jgi:hypothetical protein
MSKDGLAGRFRADKGDFIVLASDRQVTRVGGWVVKYDDKTVTLSNEDPRGMQVESENPANGDRIYALSQFCQCYIFVRSGMPC